MWHGARKPVCMLRQTAIDLVIIAPAMAMGAALAVMAAWLITTALMG